MPLRHPVKYVYIWHREEGDKGAVRLLKHSGSPRAFSPRDDKKYHSAYLNAINCPSLILTKSAKRNI